jgi:hypothetical protein
LLIIAQAPNVVIVDFDYAFFGLQREDDSYADNPQNYIIRNHPNDAREVGGRYPPKKFWCYQGHSGGKENSERLEKMTSKTDVWAIGQ